MRRVPRDVAAAGAVVVTELRGAAAGGVGRPVAAGVILAVGERRTVELRAGEHVVAVRRVADAVDHLPLLGERGRLLNVVPAPRLLERVAVQVGDVLRDAGALRVVPRSAAGARDEE